MTAGLDAPPRTMQAAVFRGGRDIRVEERPVPRPAPDEVLVHVRAAGICGSDLLAYHGLGPWQHSPEHPSEDGHELMGVIAEVGTAVTDRWVGQRVGIEPSHLVPCGSCPWCLAGTTQLCPRRGHRHGSHTMSHGFSTYDTAPWWRAHPLPDHVSDDAASILDCYGCAVHALRIVTPPAGSTVVVLGSGAIGVTTAQVARANGLRVVLTGTHAGSLAAAERAEAADVYALVGRDDVGAIVASTTGHRGAAVVFDAAGRAATSLQQAAELADRSGTLCVLGVYESAPALDTKLALDKELRIVWSNSYSAAPGPPEYAEGLALVASGRVRADELVTHRFPLERITEAFATAADKRTSGALKVVVTG